MQNDLHAALECVVKHCGETDNTRWCASILDSGDIGKIRHDEPEPSGDMAPDCLLRAYIIQMYRKLKTLGPSEIHQAKHSMASRIAIIVMRRCEP